MMSHANWLKSRFQNLLTGKGMDITQFVQTNINPPQEIGLELALPVGYGLHRRVLMPEQIQMWADLSLYGSMTLEKSLARAFLGGVGLEGRNSLLRERHRKSFSVYVCLPAVSLICRVWIWNYITPEATGSHLTIMEKVKQSTKFMYTIRQRENTHTCTQKEIQRSIVFYSKLTQLLYFQLHGPVKFWFLNKLNFFLPFSHTQSNDKFIKLSSFYLHQKMIILLQWNWSFYFLHILNYQLRLQSLYSYIFYCVMHSTFMSFR